MSAYGHNIIAADWPKVINTGIAYLCRRLCHYLCLCLYICLCPVIYLLHLALLLPFHLPLPFHLTLPLPCHTFVNVSAFALPFH